MEKKSLIKSLKIQIIVSFFLVVLGILTCNLIQISTFNSSDFKDSKNQIISVSIDSKKKPTMTKSAKGLKIKKPYNFTRINFDENYPKDIEESQSTPLQSTEIDEKHEEEPNRANLNEFKYDGYMKVGDSEIAWVKIGPERISVSKDSIIVDNFVIKEIHENYLVVKDRNNNLIQNIPFTSDKDNSKLAVEIDNAIISDKKNLNNLHVPTQRTLTQNKSKDTASNTGNANTRKDNRYETPPQIPLYDAPPMPW